MNWLLALPGCLLLAVMLRHRRHVITPALFLFAVFQIGSALTVDPYDPYFTPFMVRFSDAMKFAVLGECFWLISAHLDATDRFLSAAIGICAAGFVAGAAYNLPSPVTLHMRVLVWMASFALATLWWTWRREDGLPPWMLGNLGLLSAYLTVKATAVVSWKYIPSRMWWWANGTAEVLIAVIFLLWVKAGPSRPRKRVDRSSEESSDERGYSDNHRPDRLSVHFP